MESNDQRPLCIYHGNCFDGFTAAWAVWRRFGDKFDYLPATYGDAPPDVTDRHVFLVDFSYKRDVLMAMAATAASVIVLDHHKTAAEDLAGFELPPILSPCMYEGDTVRAWSFGDRLPRVLFDMTRSGAGIAWDYFHRDIHDDLALDRPKIIWHVEDRDLWKFDIPFTREVHAGMSAYPFEFSAWDEIAIKCENGSLVGEGGAIDRKHLRDIDTLIKAQAFRMSIGGYEVPVCNLPVTMCSDAGNIMARGEPFAATYYDNADFRCFSLRSSDAGMDVSEIAKQYGGGGHRNAAGFRIAKDSSL